MKKNVNRIIDNNKHLIIGGDSIIGKSLYNKFIKNNFDAYYTTRNNTRLNDNSIYFDLEENNINFIPKRVYVCTGISDINFCEKNPIYSWNLNVNLTLAVIKKFHNLGSHIIFLSTDLVWWYLTQWIALKGVCLNQKKT